MTNTETRVRIGRNGAKVHRGNTDGNTYCGSQARMGRRSGVSILPTNTPVTCTKCDPTATETVTEAPARSTERCPEGHKLSAGECLICD